MDRICGAYAHSVLLRPRILGTVFVFVICDDGTRLSGGVLAWLSVWSEGADLHMAQLMPLPLTVSCYSKIQIGFTFLVPTHPGCPGSKAVKRSLLLLLFLPSVL